MTLRTRNALGGAGLVTAAAVALALWRCGGSSEPARQPHAETHPAASEQRAVVGDGASSPGEQALLPPPSAAVAPDPASSEAPSAASSPSATGSGAPPSSAASRINAAIARD
ncbi:MAG TPA: hypothetical protein VFZ53_30540, partial [Polyangiaceae bacterium]